VHKNGSVVPLNWTGVWSESEGQHFFIGRDMTERLAIEARQRRSQRLEAIGQLTGGIAHDFNNLLTVIIGNLELLQMQVPEDNPLAQRLHSARRAALRGATLTAQLLAFARRQPLNAQTFDMNECIGETMRMLRRTLGENIAIELRPASDLWPTYADQTQFESALVNLALNARDAMPQGGLLVVETSNATVDEELADRGIDIPPGDYTMLVVSDTGAGMAPEVLTRVFEPFFTTKAPGKGTGMGLSMVFGFASQSNGGVKIYSEPGLGTTVRLYLPRAEATLAIDDKLTTRLLLERARDGECILVAEDNPDVRGVVAEQLSELGYRVVEADGGDAALELLRTGEAVNLLFSDVVMAGGLSGAELARAAHALRPGLRVLLTSGFALATLERRGGDTGWPLLTKPYRRFDLAMKVRSVLDG
jgi:nitrogen-specific signal transduction histidine kinase/CheY-like chemotaxis protein